MTYNYNNIIIIIIIIICDSYDMTIEFLHSTRIRLSFGYISNIPFYNISSCTLYILYIFVVNRSFFVSYFSINIESHHDLLTYVRSIHSPFFFFLLTVIIFRLLYRLVPNVAFVNEIGPPSINMTCSGRTFNRLGTGLSSIPNIL